jgi:hypothetical protein
MTGLPLLAVPDAPIYNPVLIPLIVELECLLPETFLTQDESVLVAVRIEVDDTQTTVDLDYLTPVGTAARFVEFYCFELEWETVLLN